MIFYPLQRLLECGINEIMVVTGTEHMGDMIGLLGSGRDFGCQFWYRVQDEAGGIAQALNLAKGFVNKGEKMLVILGDNIFIESIAPAFLDCEDEARIIVKGVHDPYRYGVIDLIDGKIQDIVEKPIHPPTNYAVLGAYLYGYEVFSIIETLKPSDRGELEITDVNKAYIKRGTLTHKLYEGEWTDAGTHESLLKANQMVAEKEIIQSYKEEK